MSKLMSKIPLLGVPDVPLVSSTQDHLMIADIVNDIVMFRDGGACIVLETTSLNFGLLSENEQEAVIASYAALINSLSFSIQVLVRTQKKDISNYLVYLDQAAPKIINPKLAGLMAGYKKFISDTIRHRNVLGKRFFIVIPFSPLELGLSKNFFGVGKKSNNNIPYTKNYVLKKAEVALYPKRDHIIKQAARLGLRVTQLTKEQLVGLYYDVYNPNFANVQSEDVEPDETAKE